jgi:hypothetical protein
MSVPQIKYVLIVLETKKILCEYKEEELTNIQKVIRNLLDNSVKPYEESSYNYLDHYTVFYKNDSLITILCATDINYPNSTAFEFLNSLVNSFRSLYKEEDIRQAYSYSYNNLFKKTLKTKMAYYNLNLDSKDLTNLDRLKDGLLDMKNNLVETVQTLHMREAELSHNVEKAEDLKIKTDELLINARKAKKIEKNRTPLKTIIPIVVGAVVVYCIFAIMCGGTRMPNCSI